ncbi:MAG: hypothetical protein ACRDV3_06385 [Acidothermaceae bacterium]
MDLHDFAPHYRIMFAPYCPRHQSRILLGYESVVAIEHTPSGPKVLLVCHCGELVTHTATEPAADAGSDESRCRTRV